MSTPTGETGSSSDLDNALGDHSGRTSEMSTTICRIPVLPFVNKVKAGLVRRETVPGEIMPQYLVAIHQPDNFDPFIITEETMRDIGARNKEMMAAGVRFFAGGLQPETKAKSLRAPNTSSIQAEGRRPVLAGDSCLRRADFPKTYGL